MFYVAQTIIILIFSGFFLTQCCLWGVQMVYKAKREKEELKFIISNEGKNFSGIFLYTKTSEKELFSHSVEFTQYASSPIKDEDEWTVAHRLLISANVFLDSVHSPKKGLTDICWEQFFNSKQPILI